jgi:hypothetical protein
MTLVTRRSARVRTRRRTRAPVRPSGRPGRLRAEVIRAPHAVAATGRLLAVAGNRPRRRLAFYRQVLDRKSRLYAQHAARPPLAVIALAHGYALWVGPFVRNAELSAIARSLTGGHFSSCSLRPRSRRCPHGPDLARRSNGHWITSVGVSARALFGAGDEMAFGEIRADYGRARACPPHTDGMNCHGRSASDNARG